MAKKPSALRTNIGVQLDPPLIVAELHIGGNHFVQIEYPPEVAAQVGRGLILAAETAITGKPADDGLIEIERRAIDALAEAMFYRQVTLETWDDEPYLRAWRDLTSAGRDNWRRRARKEIMGDEPAQLDGSGGGASDSDTQDRGVARSAQPE